jgi:hypothetical protein
MSHILPKSFARRMRAGAPQVISIVVNEPPKATKSNGEHVERLLCAGCERHIKVNYEDYGTRLFVDRRNIIELDDRILITNFDYKRYFLFIVSILWRASVSSLKIYTPAQGLAELSDLFRPCLLNNTLQSALPQSLRLDAFVKVALLKIVDHTSEVPQSSLDSLLHGINFKRGSTVEEGLHYYFMVDGFLVSASLFPLHSVHLKGWRAGGRLLDRSTQRIPKVSFYNIQEIFEGIAAIASTPDPFERK